MKKIVHVVLTWTPNGSGSFDWYFRKEDADKDYNKTLEDYKECPGTIIFRREHETQLEDNDEITSEIEDVQADYEDEAYRKHFGVDYSEAHYDSLPEMTSPIIVAY